MWILPAQLSSAFAAARPCLSVASKEQLAASAESSLMLRSKPTRSKTFLQKWNKGYCPRLQSGAICGPFQQRLFTEWWTSSQGGIPARDSVTLASGLGKKTLASFGLISERQSELFPQLTAFSRTLKDTLPLDSVKSCPTWLRSDTEWQTVVKNQRGDYLAREKSALLNAVNESSSWPTCRTHEVGDYNRMPSGKEQPSLTGLAKQWSTPTTTDTNRGATNSKDHDHPWSPSLKQQVQSTFGTPRTSIKGRLAPESGNGGRLENQVWPTPTASPESNRTTRSAPSHGVNHGKILAGVVMDAWPTPNIAGGGNSCELTPTNGDFLRPSGKKVHLGLDQVVKMFPTPTTCEAEKHSTGRSLVDAAKNWPSPQSRDHKSPSVPLNARPLNEVVFNGLPDQESHNTTGSRRARYRLNADWVETLMAFPIGWTDCDCWAAVSSRQPQNSPSEP